MIEIKLRKRLGLKIELYLLSLWILFFLIIVITAQIPICFGDTCKFIGVSKFMAMNVPALFATFFLVLGVISFIRFRYIIQKNSDLPVEIIELEDIHYENLTFLTTYIIPLICFNLTSARYLFALALLLVVIGLIYIKTDKFYSNPTLALLGFRVYRVKVKNVGKQVVVITRDELVDGNLISISDIDNTTKFGTRKPK
jgi:hypothetical protein